MASTSHNNPHNNTNKNQSEQLISGTDDDTDEITPVVSSQITPAQSQSGTRAMYDLGLIASTTTGFHSVAGPSSFSMEQGTANPNIQQQHIQFQWPFDPSALPQQLQQVTSQTHPITANIGFQNQPQGLLMMGKPPNVLPRLTSDDVGVIRMMHVSNAAVAGKRTVSTPASNGGGAVGNKLDELGTGNFTIDTADYHSPHSQNAGTRGSTTPVPPLGALATETGESKLSALEQSRRMAQVRAEKFAAERKARELKRNKSRKSPKRKLTIADSPRNNEEEDEVVVQGPRKKRRKSRGRDALVQGPNRRLKETLTSQAQIPGQGHVQVVVNQGQTESADFNIPVDDLHEKKERLEREEEKYQRRLEMNRKSAAVSRWKRKTYLNELEQSLSKFERIANIQAERISAQEKHIQELSRDIEHYRKENGALAGGIRGSSKKLNDVEQGLNAIEREHAAIKAEFMNMKRAFKALNKKLDELIAEQRAMNAKIDSIVALGEAQTAMLEKLVKIIAPEQSQ